MTKFVCEVCGWVYDEEEGCPDEGIARGTKFSDLPDDFVCPLCGVHPRSHQEGRCKAEDKDERIKNDKDYNCCSSNRFNYMPCGILRSKIKKEGQKVHWLSRFGMLSFRKIRRLLRL